jgi:hypothetical protein
VDVEGINCERFFAKKKEEIDFQKREEKQFLPKCATKIFALLHFPEIESCLSPKKEKRGIFTGLSDVRLSSFKKSVNVCYVTFPSPCINPESALGKLSALISVSQRTCIDVTHSSEVRKVDENGARSNER